MKRIVEIQEDIDFTELNKAYKNVIAKYDFKGKIGSIGFTCRPGAIDRVYDSITNTLIPNNKEYPEFVVEFIDTYFYKIWNQYECDRLNLFKINSNHRINIYVPEEVYNYIIVPILNLNFSGKITQAPTIGPAKAPRPTSSSPAMYL